VASEDEARRRSIAAALSRDGHRVSEARAALELLELAHVAGPSLAHPSPPDAVVLDLTGRGWAKTEMLEVLNEAPSPPPLIALVDETTQAPGAAAVLRLPVDEAAVRAEVLSVVPPGPSFRGAA
jgi:DNA-binding response OmpR family regulator